MKPEDRDLSPDPIETAAEERALARARQRLQGAGGETFWRRLEELAEERDFQKLLQRLVPGLAWPLGGALDRRHFFKIMGASLALAGLTACTRQPPEAIVPYINQPPEIVPGKPLFFTSAMPLGGAAYGILARSDMGRPTKIEGNPKHPGSLGATDAFGQAEILCLYDPDRAQTVLQYGKVSSWDAFYLALVQELQAKRAARGAGLRLLTRGIISPTEARLLGDFIKAYPDARWHRWEPVSRDHVRAGARLALGADLDPVYAFDRAGVILSLDSDFLMWEPGRLRYARDYSNGRRVRADRTDMNRLYVIESTPTITGAIADHRLPVPPSEIEPLAWALASRLGVRAPAPAAGSPALPATANRWLEAVARDLQAHPGAGLVLAGPAQPPVVQALALAINQALGNFGKTVRFIDPLEGGPADSAASITELVRDMQAGKVDILIVLGGNPAYDAPADLPFAQATQKVRLGIRHGLYEDETSLLCQWHLPETHFLESWGDARAHDGTAAIIQPLIQPLYAGRSAAELLAMMLQQPTPSAYDLVRDTWRRPLAGRGDFEQTWSAALRDGIIAGTAAPTRPATVRPEALARLAPSPRRQPASGELELIFRPDYSAWDGRYANNAWLQELPRPLTKVTWDNPALLGPATARKLGVDYMDVIELESGGRKVSAPVWIVEGHAENCLTLHLGYGRTYAGAVGTGVGANAYALRAAGSPWLAGVRASKSIGQHWEVAATRFNRGTEDRPVALNGPIAEFRKNPEFFHDKTKRHESPETLFPAMPYTGYRWGMMIDLNTCIGCNACVAACQCENNIPTVGKRQVIRSRAMHWLRVDRYFVNGDPEDPRVVFQPVPCMHCETAPCELVCPVAATVHNNEGLNEMVYNRCVGTRYCSNNCPYKVRRFNFLRFADMETMVLKMARNPEVSVRSRGVMEKCTYCVQRITNARIDAENENRRIRDGEVRTACQAVCPTNTIIFGDLDDPQSPVAAAARQPQAFTLLDHLNTRPRTNYLAHFDNLNPELEKKV